MLTVHFKFKLTNFIKALAFQVLEADTDFWADLTTLFTAPRPTSYTASNGVVISFGASSSIANIASNAITLSNTTYNLTTVTFANDTLRDTNYEKIISAIKELVLYVLSDGSLPHVCRNCFNFFNYDVDDHFCEWIDEVTDDWNIDVHYCSRYNIAPANTLKYEIYEL